jgi:hypothetical protein
MERRGPQMMGWEEGEVINLRGRDQIHTRNQRREVAETEIGMTWWVQARTVTDPE